ncbi:MAG: formyltransferase family protein [Dehalococcoidia bacterium]|nr:formyltransferase family protein [Dehalococcoidia bacterium]
MTLRLAWFATARGATSGKLLAAAHDEIAAGRLDARIAAVFCNRAPGEDANTDAFLDQVRRYGLPLVTLSSRDFRRAHGGEIAHKGGPLPQWRRDYDREVMRLLEPYPFDIGVLAGYMLIFCEEAAARWDLLNLHPAPPGGPSGMWQDVVWHLIEARAVRSGVMMHLATPALDQGPVVTYCTYPLRGPQFAALWREIEGCSVDEIKAAEGESNRLFAEIRRHGVARELPLVVETLRAFADGRVRIVARRVVDAAGRPIPGYDLTDRIESLVAPTL